MRILFFGEDAFSCIVLDSLVKAGHEVLGVFCPVYNNLIYQRLNQYCANNHILFERIADFSSPDFITRLAQSDVDLNVVCHFQKLIKKELIQLPKYGSVNLHPSLLPEYRGMAPQHWPIINGDIQTGITVHFIDEGIDTGDIILQKRISIGEDTYVSELQNQMKDVYKIIMKEAIDLILDNSTFIKQSHLDGSYYGKLKRKDCEIRDYMSRKDVYNLIRGVSFPYFGARYKNLIIWKAKVVDSDKNLNDESQDELMQLIYLDSDTYLKCYDGFLKIEKSEIYES